MSIRILFFAMVWLIAIVPIAHSQNYSSYNQKFVDEHIFEGFPGFENIHIRQAYILSYNHAHRIPNWVAYHVQPDYLKTVPRYGRFSQFRTDYHIPHPVGDHEYDGLNGNGKGYVRGHLVPFGISGGDRDGDLLYGVADINRDGVVNSDDMKGRALSEFIEDADELSRVYEINQMSNITPQDHDGFNGNSGIWGKLESFIQRKVKQDLGNDFWVIAGPVLGRGEMQKVGPNKDITVPPMFFKIVVRKDKNDNPLVLAFLMPHHKEPRGDIEDYLVSVDIIEAMTGLDFFRDLNDEAEASLESVDTWVNWKRF